MEWLKANAQNPMFLLAVAVVVIAIWFMTKGMTKGIK